MIERPLIMNEFDVHALADGRKTQKRVVIKPVNQKIKKWHHCLEAHDNVWRDGKPSGVRKHRKGNGRFTERFYSEDDPNLPQNALPLWIGEERDGTQHHFRQPASIYWVREKWQIAGWNPDLYEVKVRFSNGDLSGWIAVHDGGWFNKVWKQCTDECIAMGVPLESPDIDDSDYDLTDFSLRWRSSTQMPRWMSRFRLRVIDVYPQRLKDINANDAVAEGVESQEVNTGYSYEYLYGFGLDRVNAIYSYSALSAFRELWQSTAGGKNGCSWDENPWVWVINFEVVQ